MLSHPEHLLLSRCVVYLNPIINLVFIHYFTLHHPERSQALADEYGGPLCGINFQPKKWIVDVANLFNGFS